jgi:hypothetical protein
MSQQLLTSWAAKSLTSGSIGVTADNILSANLAAIANLSNRDVLAFSVYAKIYQLAAAGGANYKASHAQLRTDATNFLGQDMGLLNDPRNGDYSCRIQAVIDWNAAYLVDNTITTDVWTISAGLKGLRETPEPTLLMFYFYLRYQLAN